MESWHGDCTERESKRMSVCCIRRHVGQNEGRELQVKQEKEAQQMRYRRAYTPALAASLVLVICVTPKLIKAGWISRSVKTDLDLGPHTTPRASR